MKLWWVLKPSLGCERLLHRPMLKNPYNIDIGDLYFRKCIGYATTWTQCHDLTSLNANLQKTEKLKEFGTKQYDLGYLWLKNGTLSWKVKVVIWGWLKKIAIFFLPPTNPRHFKFGKGKLESILSMLQAERISDHCHCRYWTQVTELQPVFTSNFSKSVCAQNFLCATFYQHPSIFGTPCIVGRDGALVEAITFNRMVVGSTPALAVT